MSVTIDGKPAPLYFISPTQIDALVPAGIAADPVQVWVTNDAGSSVPVFVHIAAVSPAFFAWRDSAGKAFAVATFPNFRLAGVAGNPPARPGDVLILWGSGFGPTNPATAPEALPGAPAKIANAPAITIGGAAADYVGGALAPGLAGVYQIAVRVPDLPDGEHEVLAVSGGIPSPRNVYLSVHR